MKCVINFCLILLLITALSSCTNAEKKRTSSLDGNENVFENNDISQSSQSDNVSQEVDDIIEETPTQISPSTNNEGQRLRELIKEADEGGILIGANGNSFRLNDTFSKELYNSLDDFTETKEGHLYDGIIECFVIFSDGTILGVYSTPIKNVPENYADCKGKMYGAIYKVNEDSLVESTVYGFFSEQATELPLDRIGY